MNEKLNEKLEKEIKKEIKICKREIKHLLRFASDYMKEMRKELKRNEFVMARYFLSGAIDNLIAVSEKLKVLDILNHIECRKQNKKKLLMNELKSHEKEIYKLLWYTSRYTKSMLKDLKKKEFIEANGEAKKVIDIFIGISEKIEVLDILDYIMSKYDENTNKKS